MAIVTIGHGLAYRVGKDIYINSELCSDPVLWSRIIDHEYSHTAGCYSLRDLVVDVWQNLSLDLRLDWFILRHPSTWTVFLPLNYVAGRWGFCPVTAFKWLCLCLFVGYLL